MAKKRVITAKQKAARRRNIAVARSAKAKQSKSGGGGEAKRESVWDRAAKSKPGSKAWRWAHSDKMAAIPLRRRPR